MDSYSSGHTIFYGDEISVYNHLVLIKNQRPSITTYNDYPSGLPYRDQLDKEVADTELGHFSLEKIEEKIIDIVQKSGIPFS
jgi:hypothetical protein